MFRAALDPGLHSPGLTLGTDSTVTHTFHLAPTVGDKEPYGRRCMDIAVVAFVSIVKTHGESVELIFEWPQVYDSRAGKMEGDPNGLTPLVGIGMALAGLLCAHQRLDNLVTPKPAEWIGSVPKKCQLCKRAPGKKSCKLCHGSAWVTPRGSLIRERLTPEELQLVPDQNDVIDSVGILLWRAGRLRPSIPGLVTA